MSASDWIVGVLLLTGAFLFLISALGLLRFPDVFTRMSAAAKSSTLGAMCMLAAYGLAYVEVGVDARAIVAMVFLVLTAPVAAHALARAAYRRGQTLSESTEPDELAGRLAECDDTHSGEG